MNTVTASRPDLRASFRRPGDALPGASIGTVPMLWEHGDVTNASQGSDAATIVDEIARIGFEGTQFGTGFPQGERLRDELARRGLRLAEVYCWGPPSESAAIGRRVLAATLRRLGGRSTRAREEVGR